jgi:hypothetical protein
MDPRAKGTGICGVTRIGGTGIEWVCIRQVHAKVYNRHKNGAPIYNDNPKTEQHYFVPKWPHRKDAHV